MIGGKLLYMATGYALGTKQGRKWAIDATKKIVKFVDKKFKQTDIGEIVKEIFDDEKIETDKEKECVNE